MPGMGKGDTVIRSGDCTRQTAPARVRHRHGWAAGNRGHRQNSIDGIVTGLSPAPLSASWMEDSSASVN